MNVDPTLQTLIKEFGSQIGVGELTLDNDGACALRLGEDLRIDFQYRPDRDHLVIYADLGVATGPEIYPELLRGNLFWRMTSGATLSLSNDSPPHVVLALTTDWRSLRVTSLQELVERFITTARDWIEIMKAPGEHESDGAGNAAVDADMTVFRV
jgi:hypothetical protein